MTPEKSTRRTSPKAFFLGRARMDAMVSALGLVTCVAAAAAPANQVRRRCPPRVYPLISYYLCFGEQGANMQSRTKRLNAHKKMFPHDGLKLCMPICVLPHS